MNSIVQKSANVPSEVARVEPLPARMSRQNSPENFPWSNATPMKLTRKNLLCVWSGCLALLLTIASPAARGADAKPPEKMAFQGFLTDGNGNARGLSQPVNIELTFRLYKTSTAAQSAAVWAEKQTVTVDKGHFSVVLGEGVLVSGTANFPAHFTGGDTDSGRYLGIQVTGESEISPRIQFFTAPYAFHSRFANELLGTDGSKVLKTTADKVGINLSGAPSTALEVGGTATMTGLNVNGTALLGGSVLIPGSNFLEFGYGVPKEGSAGKFGYSIFTPNTLDIVGAGTTGNNRKVKIWAEGGTTFTGPVTATTFSGAYTGDGSGLSGVAKLDSDNTFTGYQEIRNHVRLGEVSTTVGSAGWGKALIFSGAAPVSSSWNGDNSDPLWMARYNTAGNSSELRMVIGDDPGNVADQFVVGTMSGANFTQGGTWAPQFSFHANGALEFRPGITKEVSAGQIGYQIHSNDSLDIVGAGTSGSNRKVQIWSEAGLQLNGGMNVSTPSWGQTFQVLDNVVRVFKYNDKNAFFQMWRYDGGVALYAQGGGFANGGGQYARQITWDGDGNWDVSSDRKLKKDIVDAEPMLDRALKVQVRRFRWKDATEDARPSLGVIAQELQPLFPDMISEQEDPNTKERNLAVGYSDFGIIAVKAIQELNEKHTAETKEYKAQIADLKAQLAELNAQVKLALQATADLQLQMNKSKTTAAITK